MILWLLFAQASASTGFIWTFEMDDGDFVAENHLHWQWGLTSDGTWGWATRLHDMYLNDVTDSLEMPPLELSTFSRPVLGIVHQYDIDESGSDAGWLETKIGGLWTRIEPVYGYPDDLGFAGSSESTQTSWFDLSSFEESPSIRFVFTSDESVRRDGWIVDDVLLEDGDPVPPKIDWVSELESTTDIEGPYSITAHVIDDVGVEWVQVEWVDNQGNTGRDDLRITEDGTYKGAIVGHDPGSVIEWWMEASDGRNITHWPAEGPNDFSVYLPAPVDLYTDPAPNIGRLAETTVDLHWTPPPTEHTVVGYVVTRDGVDLAETQEPKHTVGLIDGTQQLTVRARFEIEGTAFDGEQSSPLNLNVSLPILETVEPNESWPEDRIRVLLAGKNLYLSHADTELDPGEGIQIESFDIIDAHSARALLYIAPEAQPGSRRFSLMVGDMLVFAEPDFVVQSVGGRPVVLGAHPTSVRQGAQAKIFIDMSAPAEMTRPPPVVDLGEGIIIESVERRGSGLDVQVSVAHDAPLGDHPIEVDEGDRLLEGASLEVRDTPKVPERNCSSATKGTIPWWALLLNMWAITWRRHPQRNEQKSPS